MFRNPVVVNILISIVIANVLILIGKDGWIELYQEPKHYLDMLVTFISVFVVFQYAFSINKYLNKKIPWNNDSLKRSLLQFSLGIVIPALMAILFTYIMWEFLWHKDLIVDGYFKYEYLPQLLLITVVNLFFIISDLFRNMQNTNKDSLGVIIGAKGGQKVPVKLDEIAYISLNGGITYLTSMSESKLMLSESMDHYEQFLSSNYFRANRQFIISRKHCQAYKSIENGKIQVSLSPDNTLVIVSQKRASAFRSWIGQK